MRSVLGLLLMLVLTPAVASAVTVQEIIALTHAGVSEQLILALIERENSVFPLPASEVTALKRAGVSDAVVLAMLRSGPPLPPPPPAPAVNAEEQPELIVVGHDPGPPRTVRNFDAPVYVPY